MLEQNLTYKPGHTLTFHEVEGKIVFSVDARVYDSRTGRPDTPVKYTSVITVPETSFEENKLRYVLAQVREALHDFEKHEADEWFCFEGEQVRPPHRHYPPEQQ
jgi:hypothetical protein